MKQTLFKVSLLLGGLLLAGCTNPFTTRADQVEPPITNGVVYNTPNQPEIVFENFTKSIQNKNIQEYMRCLSEKEEQYHFEPAQYYREEFRNINWQLDDERSYFTELTKSSKSDFPRLNFAFTDTTTPRLRPIYPQAADDSVESDYVSYRFRIAFSADSSQTYEGDAHFKLYHNHDSDRWFIYYWQDRAKNSVFERTVSALKLTFYKSATQ
jgi:hypothetical protein